MKLKIKKDDGYNGSYTTFANGGYCKARGDHSYPSMWEGTPGTARTPDSSNVSSLANTPAVQAIVVVSAVASIALNLPSTTAPPSRRNVKQTSTKQRKQARPAADKK